MAFTPWKNSSKPSSTDSFTPPTINPPAPLEVKVFKRPCSLKNPFAASLNLSFFNNSPSFLGDRFILAASCFVVSVLKFVKASSAPPGISFIRPQVTAPARSEGPIEVLLAKSPASSSSIPSDIRFSLRVKYESE